MESIGEEVLFDGDKVVGVGDKVGVIPLLRRLLRDGNGRRARWGRWGLAFALLRRMGKQNSAHPDDA
eukprot:scaffold32758_cov129-Isochrysis_galbana.AAC.1